MEIILKEDVKGLGYKNDVVKVKPGYGRNFLIPQGMGIVANQSNLKRIEENVRQAAHKAEKVKNDALELASKIGDLTLVIKTKAGESGKIFGAVTALQVSDALKENGFEIERKRITLSTNIKELGDYKVTLDLHKEVHHTLALKVVSE